jgi:hypothetical protein
MPNFDEEIAKMIEAQRLAQAQRQNDRFGQGC